jgi:cardiolipin synthase
MRKKKTSNTKANVRKKSVKRSSKKNTHRAYIRINRYSIEEISKRFTKLKNRLFLPQFLREMRKLKIGGLTGGNRVTIISDGDTCFNEFIKAIKAASDSINLETYIFNSDEVGWEIARHLVEKAHHGVEVNLIYDSIGCIETSPEIFTFMREGGVEVLEYHPFIPWRKFWNVSLRDHRKILVIDGKIAFVGGINIGKEYSGKKYNGGNWRDTHLRIEGLAVRDIQFFFIENWYRYGGAIIDNYRHFPIIEEEGKKLVMVLSSKSRKKIKPIKESYLSAIKFAKDSIFITNAYFIPDKKIYRSLIQAARRGVNVCILLPGKSDILIVKYASRFLYKKYLKGRIKIFEYTGSILHAKTAVVDGIWSTVGSSNLDRRSFRKNLEINAIILDQQFGEQMERIFYSDLKKSSQLEPESWRRRSFYNYVVEWICYRFRNYL